MNEKQTQVLLVSMPFAAVERPSLALGLLSAILQRAGIETSTEYANLRFLEQLSPRDYVLVEKVPPDNCFGDWIFARKVFGYDDDNTDEYIDGLMENVPLFARLDRDRFAKRIRNIRAQGEEFIDSIADRVVAAQPRIVACSSTFQQHLASLALLKRVKERNPGIVTLIGGANKWA